MSDRRDDHAKREPRSLLHKLTGNTLVGFAGSVTQKGLTFATTMVLARGLGGERFGVYSYVIAYMFFFGFFSDLGLERIVTRDVARQPHRAGELLGSAILVKLGLSIGALLAAVAGAYALDLPAEARICIVLSAVGLPLSLELIFRGYFQTRYEIRYSLATTLPGTAAYLGVAALVVSRGWPLYLLFIGALAIGVAIVGTLLVLVGGRVRLSLRLRSAELRSLLRDAWSVGLFILLFMLSLRMDQIMLFHFRGAADVGLYTVGVRLSEALSLIPDALLITVFPLLASSEHAAPERYHQTYRLSFKYLAAVFIPIALVLTVLRREVVGLIFGQHYAAAGDAMAILAWNMFFGYTGAVYVNLFIAQARQRLLLLVSGLAVAVNFVCNLLWIPVFGPAGAATATLVANVVGFVCWIGIPVTRPFMLVCVRESWRPLAAGVAALAASTLFSTAVASTAAMVATYGAVVWGLGGIAWADVALVQQLFASEERPLA